MGKTNEEKSRRNDVWANDRIRELEVEYSTQKISHRDFH